MACDVRTRFVDAADVFAPAEGRDAGAGRAARAAGSSGWPRCTWRTYGVDVRDARGRGAAGGLAGGLAAMGAELVAGFELVADELDLDGRIEGADLVVTGEGFLDEQCFEGKVVGGVAELAAEAGVPVRRHRRARCSTAPTERIAVVSLVERFGEERSGRRHPPLHRGGGRRR